MRNSPFLYPTVASLIITCSLVFAAKWYSMQPTEAEVLSSMTVQVINKDVSMGSGVVVGKKDLEGGWCQLTVVTADHMVHNVKHALEVHNMEASIVISHPTEDIAILLVPMPWTCSEDTHRSAQIDMISTPFSMERLVHVGYPNGEYMVGTSAYVSTVLMMERWELHSMTSVGGPGSSGGPIFYNGKLIGVLVMGETQNPFRNYYVSIQHLNAILPTIE